MCEPIIYVENVSKAFPLTKQISLRHEFSRILAQYLKTKLKSEPSPIFYALRDVSFTIRKGEAVAVIGRNGSGKSTLLRIMARIMRPTSGRSHVIGRCAALISLGAGFIPTLTGRENIYLYSAFHGLNRKRVDAMIEDVISFADIGHYIDMPVQDYSTGMSARLAFSTAVHVLPDIIFLDEVLSVGDAGFQKKCMERIMQFKAEKRTIVFVSHSENSVKALCERALWLDKGTLRMDGAVDEVMDAYNIAVGK